MNFKERRESFVKRFNLTDTYDPQQESDKFKTRILNIFDRIDYHIEQEGIEEFCNCLGKKVKTQNRFGATGIEFGSNIISSLISEKNEIEFYFLIELIFTLRFKSYRGIHSKESYIYKIKEAIEISHINLSMSITSEEQIILHPRGEEKLDKILLEETFSFLNSEASAHFLSALKSYSKRKLPDSIKSAESIRRCIEEFLRFKLENIRGLDKNKIELGNRLKSDKIAPQLRTIISQIFDYLDKYFNDHSKHHDGDIGEAENEFLLYQAALLMRYINRIL